MMNIFSEIEGLHGENLTSALLHYLLLNSQEVKDAFIDLLSDHSPLLEPIYSYEHFSVKKEYPTQDDKLSNGRLDLLIQLDDFVIGIENKLHASFQPNQPEKYIKSINEVGQQLEKIYSNSMSCLLFILCPEYKKGEAVEKTKFDSKMMAVITWEQVLNKFKNIENVDSPRASILLDEFIKYLSAQFSFFPSFKKKSHHFRSSFPARGTSLQYELNNAIWKFFPSPSNHISIGNNWLGYGFHYSQEAQGGWFGFVSKSVIRGDCSNEAELIIATNYRPDSIDGLVEIELSYSNFVGKNTFINRVDFDASWDNIEKWQRVLSVYGQNDTVEND
ncbi:hypothetical protein AMR76_06560 [Vibrio furnissii]|uniref:PD-(D/E)XK nuclease superfamily protein n=1 Tax=Vibrio furnissii TaxID=29494 RepID=A0A0Q2SGI1_VIBFU|nr:PD-(D/E)XK nuclease family protein [Vibrio furnissii]KQH86747.1 hypothetical protein AMR76_06560 [Vibrio furnissii]OQQ02346.1 hypothetical protein BK411_22100 [Vibrio splendidus]